jgi:hypothetical protein
MIRVMNIYCEVCPFLRLRSWNISRKCLICMLLCNGTVISLKISAEVHRRCRQNVHFLAFGQSVPVIAPTTLAIVLNFSAVTEGYVKVYTGYFLG